MDQSIARFRWLRVPAVLTTIGLLAACGNTTGGTTPSAATGTKGGTLTMLGTGDVDHLDPASAYYTVSFQVIRGYSRQLVTYPTSSDPNASTSIVADMATQVPSTSNGGVKPEGVASYFQNQKGG